MRYDPIIFLNVFWILNITSLTLRLKVYLTSCMLISYDIPYHFQNPRLKIHSNDSMPLTRPWVASKQDAQLLPWLLLLHLVLRVFVCSFSVFLVFCPVSISPCDVKFMGTSDAFVLLFSRSLFSAHANKFSNKRKWKKQRQTLWKWI